MIYDITATEGFKSDMNNINNGGKYVSHCSNESIIISTIVECIIMILIRVIVIISMTVMLTVVLTTWNLGGRNFEKYIFWN